LQIPKTIKIGGHIIKIIFDPTCRTDDGYACCGMNRTAKEEITINPGYPQGTQEATLIHEILEAINTTHELGLEHRQICTLEDALYQVLKDNELHFDKAGE